MPKTPHRTLLEQLKSYTYWMQDGDDFVSVNAIGQTLLPRRSYSADDFDALSPGLSDLLVELCQTPYPSGQTILCAIDFWNDDYVVFPADCYYDGYDAELHVRNFSRVTRHPDYLSVTCTYFELLTSEMGHTYSERTATEHLLQIRHDWLDAAFPGWQARYDIGVAFDMDVNQVGRLVFEMDEMPVPQVKTASLPDEPML